MSNAIVASTLAACPLPLATFYKADTSLCHDVGSSLAGLWLSVFIYVFLLTLGLCIGGQCFYKRWRTSAPRIDFTPSTIYF